MSFVDIAGIVRGASEGEGLGNKFLANIREADAICQVIRAFTDDDVVHVEGKVSPRDDIETINTELILADLQTLEKAVPRLEKEVKGKKAEKSLLDNAVAAQKVLEAGDTLFAAGAAAGVDLDAIRELSLLTTKPFLYVFNLDEDGLTDDALKASLAEIVAPADAIYLNAKLEMDLAELEPEDAAELLESVGVEEAGMNQLARVGFSHAGAPDLPHGRPQGDAGLDHPPGLDRAPGGRCHPHRLPARVHQGRGRVVRRPGRGRFDGRGQGQGPGTDRGQGLRHGRRRRGGVPLQRLRRRLFPQVAGLRAPHGARTGHTTTRHGRPCDGSGPPSRHRVPAGRCGVAAVRQPRPPTRPRRAAPGHGPQVM